MIPLDYCQPVPAPVPALGEDVHQTVERFHRWMAGGQLAARTCTLYSRAVLRWFAFGGQPGHVDGALLARYLATRRRTCGVAAINMDLKALRAFYRCQLTWGDVDAAQLLKLPSQRKPPARMPRWLTDDQVGAVLAACPLGTFIGLRDYAMILTLYAAGLRASELIGLQLGDYIDRSLLFVTGKGGHVRYVPTGDQLAGVLDGYLHARAGLRPGKKAAFWLRADGRPLRNGRSVWEIVSKRIWQALGIQAGMHRVNRGGRPWTGHFPHELRASFATALLHRGMDLMAIAQLMGHTDVATTAHYLGVDLPYLREQAARHPRALRAGASGSLDRSAMKALNVSRSKSLDDATPRA